MSEYIPFLPPLTNATELQYSERDMNTNVQNFNVLIDSVSSRVPRMTKSLLALLSVLHASPGPISVQELMRRLASRRISINKVTVYRKLELLRTIDVVQEVLLSGEKKYYELTREHHHHLVCLSCEQVTDWVPDESLLRKEESRLGRQGFQVRYHSLELFGLCRQCL